MDSRQDRAVPGRHRPLALPGSISGLPLPNGHLALLPASRAARDCYRLLAQCRRLAEVAMGPDGYQAWVPATKRLVWVGDQGAGYLPLPELAPPAGVPAERWLAAAAADARGVLTVMGKTLHMVDLLAGHGFVAQPFSPADVWVAGGEPTWLPAALTWRRVGRWPTRETLAAGRLAGARFAQRLALAAWALSGMAGVWDELWALCQSLLSPGSELNMAPVRRQLLQLRGQLTGAAARGSAAPGGSAPAAPHPDLWVLVDAGGIQRAFPFRTLDLCGLLRHLVGPDRHTTGVVVGGAGLPPHWRAQAKAAGLRWQEGEQPGDWEGLLLARHRRRGDALHALVICAAAGDVAATLAALRPQRGQVVSLASGARAARLSGPWSALAVPAGRWWRLGLA